MTAAANEPNDAPLTRYKLLIRAPPPHTTNTSPILLLSEQQHTQLMLCWPDIVRLDMFGIGRGILHLLLVLGICAT